MAIAWGPESRLFYNDRYRPILGQSKHPNALGAPVQETFPEAWAFISPLFEETRSGGTVGLDDALVPLDRNGYLESCWFTFSYSPIRDESGAVGGVLIVCTETTARVEGERRLGTLGDLARRTAATRSRSDAARIAVAVLAENPVDVPFALIYSLDHPRATARRVAHCGMAEDHPAMALEVDLAGADSWPLAAVVSTRNLALVTGASLRFASLPGGGHPESAHTVAVIPLVGPGRETPSGFLVAGVSPRRAFDDAYHTFFGLVGEQISAALAHAGAYEDERGRADAFLELDRVKTQFFSNVSHEFRTPLTLMLGPLEDMLAGRHGELTGPLTEALSMMRRNSQRLLKLVNTLLDFSRLESGGVKGAFAGTDLGPYTAELASVFREAMEGGQLRFEVECAPLGEPTFVDREMWEQIVLNLLSNAFKFTLEGSVTVTLRHDGPRVRLDVVDTGSGFSTADGLRVFERFHRLEGQRSRTHEGTGIGLALVSELVKLHGGEVQVESKPGRGSTFSVFIPRGSAHLPREQLVALGESKRGPPGTGLVAEALDWEAKGAGGEAEAPPQGVGWVGVLPRILLVDDNPDLRAYLTHLLVVHWRVEACADGAAALAAAQRDPPDLVLTDVTMPGLDGFELVHALRSDSRTRNVPVIMLSARAGEEARASALAAGADDYLVKPFPSKELVGRVRATLERAHARLGASGVDASVLRAAIFKSTTFSCIATDASGIIQLFNVGAERMLGYAPADVINTMSAVNLHDSAELTERARELGREFGVPIAPGFEALVFKAALGFDDIYEVTKIRKDGSRLAVVLSVTALRDTPGTIIGYLLVCTDNTTRHQAEEERTRLDERLRDQQFYTRSLIEASLDVVVTTDPGGIVMDVNRQAEALTGQTRDELIGAPLSRCFADPQQVDAMLAAVLTRKTLVGHELDVRSGDGSTVTVSCNTTTFYGRDRRLAGVLVSARDVTTRRRDERLLRDSNAELEQARAGADNANRAKSMFLTGMSHELRSPLNSILGFAQLLESASPAPSEADRASVSRILQSGWHLLALIDEILDLATVESGKVSLSVEPLSLADVMLECQAMMEGQGARRGLTMRFPTVDAAVIVSADRTRLKQIIINLLSNAIKYNSERGSISVTYEVGPGATTRIRVTDTGEGLSAADVAQLFQPFNRLGQAARGLPGTGIGLVMTRRLAELMGGAVGVESAVGRGSTFWCDLPTAEAPDEPGAGLVEHHQIPTTAPGGTPVRTVLYVEDVPANREVVERLLARRPELALLTAGTGMLGVELAQRHLPSVILMDINLPDISGVEAVRLLRSDPVTAHIPVVALTANAMADDRARGHRTGFFRYLTKPIRLAEFTDTLNAALAFAERARDNNAASA